MVKNDEIIAMTELITPYTGIRMLNNHGTTWAANMMEIFHTFCCLITSICQSHCLGLLRTLV